MNNIIAVIPARLYSERLKEKILANINGKSMIERVYRQTQKAKLINKIYIATDNEKSLKHCKTFCNNTILSSDKHKSGTDRIAEVITHINCDGIINIQADQPLINPALIDEIANTMQNNNYSVISPFAKIQDTTLIKDPNCVKVTITKDNYAIYFSRAPIPYHREENNKIMPTFLAHIGVYAYSRNFLLLYPKLKKGHYEEIEKLEQLRIIENGYKIKMIETNHITQSVDCQKDLNVARLL